MYNCICFHQGLYRSGEKNIRKVHMSRYNVSHVYTHVYIQYYISVNNTKLWPIIEKKRLKKVRNCHLIQLHMNVFNVWCTLLLVIYGWSVETIVFCTGFLLFCSVLYALSLYLQVANKNRCHKCRDLSFCMRLNHMRPPEHWSCCCLLPRK